MCAQNTQKSKQTLKTLLPTIQGGMMVTTIHLKMSRSRGGEGVTVADKDDDKDTEKDVDENKDLMKNDSVQ